MNSPNGTFEKNVNLENRNFSLKIQQFDNGYFVFLNEGSNKIGSMVASLATGPTPVTTTIIPSKTESLFLKFVAERISTKKRGICVVSVYIKKELESSTAKGLMSAIMDIVDND